MKTSRTVSRREFIKAGMAAAGAACMGCTEALAASESAAGAIISSQTDGEFPLYEAMHYKKLEDARVECQLCPRGCKIADLERGYCGVRENRDGTYYTLVHSRVCALHADPIEKKPFFHYLPGTRALSIATPGCNVECRFCQNWQISQFRPEQVNCIKLTPNDVIERTRRSRSASIAYTYSEPVIFYEFMYDTARTAKQEGIASVMVSNGYIKEKPLVELCRHLAAVKIDLKAFTEKFYKETCSGELKPVLETLSTLKKLGMWFEIVVLIVPTLNDGDEELREMCGWVFNELGPDVPLHFSRFHPTYKIKNLPPTPINTLERAWDIARDTGLNYSYIGNVPGHKAENTYCPECKEIAIERVGYTIVRDNIKGGRCNNCEHPIPGVWDLNM